jgi:pimeloyl-ACP methyl ester carboxylesterase
MLKMKHSKILIAAIVVFIANLANADIDDPKVKSTVVQEQRWFTYKEKGSFGSSSEIKLEVMATEPTNWNGKIVVMNHGSTGRGHGSNGYDESRVKTTVKFPRVAAMLTAKGYKTFLLMRKGRGNSEGKFVEEDARTCSWGDQMRGVDDAEPQVDQFVDWVRSEYKVDKVIMLGHSRGGFMSSYYASRHPDKVEYALNISGGWTTACEYKNNMTAQMLKDSSTKFKNQTWVYSSRDSYFTDAQTEGYKEIADKSGIQFISLENTSQGDGHGFATANPKLWVSSVPVFR